MSSRHQMQLTRRERQIMDAVYSLGKATATQVVGEMADPPSRTTIRTLLRILESKGHLRHTKSGREFVYSPTRPRQRVGVSALQRVLSTFFSGSLEKAVAAHLSDRRTNLTPEELKRLTELINRTAESEESS